MRSKIIKHFIIALVGFTNTVIAAESSLKTGLKPRLATNEVENQIALDREANPLYKSRLLSPLQDWRNGVTEKTGFNWSLDYTSVLMEMDGSAGEDNAGSGIVRLFGFWDLVDRGGPNKGSLNWKIENRHSYTDVAVNDLGFESGYVGLFEAPFSNQQTRLTNLYWKQYFADGNATAVAGFLDPTDFLDVYLMASPWTGFNNFVFSTGSATMDLPNDATLGAAIGGLVSEKIYIHAGIGDANSDPTDPFDGFDSFVSESDYFSWLEFGHIPGLDQIYFDNTHLTLWHIDKRANGSPGG